MVTISTAGDDEETPLGRLRLAARQLPGLEVDGAHHYVNHDGFALHEWALEPGESLDDMELVKRANPAPWHTVESLRARHDSPSTSPWEWARFACGVWLTGEQTWLEHGAWEACREDGAEIPDGAPVYLGVDVGIKRDTSAIVTCWKRSDDRIVVKAQVFTPPANEALDLSLLEGEIRRQADRFEVMAVAYDRWTFERSAQMLSDEGLLMVEMPMTNERTVPASTRLYEAINAKRICHDGDPVLAAHVNAGVTRDTERGWRLAKSKRSNKPVDALIALLIAYPHVDQALTGGGFEW
jgi:phage terminase large subunit-like protein